MRCVELFAGGGGAALGLRAAGFSSVACVEADAAACRTLRGAGFPAVQGWIGNEAPPGSSLPLWPTSDDIARIAASGADLDVVWASPPCQPWSMAGKREGHSDSREGSASTIAALQRLRPRFVIVENVRGFPAHDFAAQLVEAGVCAPGHVRVWDLDAVRYGLPSRRRRVFVVGRREVGPMPRIPLFTHYAPEDERLIEGAGEAARAALLRQMQRWVSMGEALLGLRGAVVAGNGGNKPVPRDLGQPSHAVTGSCPLYYTAAQTGGAAGSQPEMLDLPAPCVVTSEAKGTRARKANGWTYNGGPDRAADAAFMATGRRRLEPEEVAVLVGFPPDHHFSGTKEQVYRQIGNAVAPVQARVIAESILRVM